MQRSRNPKVKPSKRQRQRVRALTAEGMCRERVAVESGLSIAKLRTEFAVELDEGRQLLAEKKNDEAQAEQITKAEYYVLDMITKAMNSHWQHPTLGNLLFRGTDNNGARSVADAFLNWKLKSGRWNCAGLSGKFDPEKLAAFSKIVNEYRNRNKTEKEKAK